MMNKDIILELQAIEKFDGVYHLEELTREVDREMKALNGVTSNYKKNEIIVNDPRSKSGDIFSWGTLVITLIASGGVVTSLIDLLKEWQLRKKEVEIILKYKDTEIILRGQNAIDSKEEVENWINKIISQN